MYLTPTQINSHNNITDFKNKSAFKPRFRNFETTKDLFIKSSFESNTTVSFGTSSQLANKSALVISDRTKNLLKILKLENYKLIDRMPDQNSIKEDGTKIFATTFRNFLDSIIKYKNRVKKLEVNFNSSGEIDKISRYSLNSDDTPYLKICQEFTNNKSSVTIYKPSNGSRYITNRYGYNSPLSRNQTEKVFTVKEKDYGFYLEFVEPENRPYVTVFEIKKNNHNTTTIEITKSSNDKNIKHSLIFEEDKKTIKTDSFEYSTSKNGNEYFICKPFANDSTTCNLTLEKNINREFLLKDEKGEILVMFNPTTKEKVIYKTSPQKIQVKVCDIYTLDKIYEQNLKKAKEILKEEENLIKEKNNIIKNNVPELGTLINLKFNKLIVNQ